MCVRLVVTEALARFGLDAKKLEEQDALRILDSYTVQTGLGVAEASEKSRVPRYYSQSVKFSDLSITDAQRIKSRRRQEAIAH